MGVVQLLNNIQRGKEGKNIGISTGLPIIDSKIFGIQRKALYTIGADTSAGKTSFAIDIFVYNLIKNAGDIPINILYYSFEMSSDMLFAKLLSRHIYDEYNEIVTHDNILSLLSPISDHQLDLVHKSTEWLNSISKVLTIYDKALSPAGIYATCKEWLKQFGDFNQIGEHREEYIEHNPSQYKEVIIDHVALIASSDSRKSKIDTVVEYMIYFRNKCNITGVFIQQINRTSKSVERRTSGYELLQTDDLKDTGDTAQASEVVFMLFFPHREKIARCENYPIQNILKKRFRLLQVVKNRYGEADFSKGATFHGEIGMFRELPRPEEISDYSKYIDLDYKEQENIDNQGNNNTFQL